MRGTVERPAGLRYIADAIPRNSEQELLRYLETLDLERVTIRGNTARRTVRHYGRRYDYGAHVLRDADPIPAELEPMRRRAEELAGLAPGAIIEALVNHYPAAAGIGWHADAAIYKTIVGISLGTPCRLQFRTGATNGRRVFEQTVAPRSAYVMTGPVASQWQHRIAATDGDRFSLTFRSLEAKAGDDEPSIGLEER
jgi:DNA oxidative demethylase